MQLINKYGTTYSAYTSDVIPTGKHTLPPTASNILSANSVYPAPNLQKGGKNKIIYKYKMKYSKKHKHRHHKNCSHNKSRRSRRINRLKYSRRRRQKGGFLPPMTTPHYPPGHLQYQNNDGSLSNTYSRGGVLPPSLSALANPAPYTVLKGDVDNLNHATLNSYGNIGAGSGFASRGWF